MWRALFQIDHSVVESFGAGGKTCILTRVYPRKAIGDDAHLFVFNNGESDIKDQGHQPARMGDEDPHDEPAGVAASRSSPMHAWRSRSSLA